MPAEVGNPFLFFKKCTNLAVHVGSVIRNFARRCESFGSRLILVSQVVLVYDVAILESIADCGVCSFVSSSTFSSVPGVLWP